MKKLIALVGIIGLFSLTGCNKKGCPNQLFVSNDIVVVLPTV